MGEFKINLEETEEQWAAQGLAQLKFGVLHGLVSIMKVPKAVEYSFYCEAKTNKGSPDFSSYIYGEQAERGTESAPVLNILALFLLTGKYLNEGEIIEIKLFKKREQISVAKGDGDCAYLNFGKQEIVATWDQEGIRLLSAEWKKMKIEIVRDDI